MKIGIIGAMQQEVAILKDLIEDVQEVNQAIVLFTAVKSKVSTSFYCNQALVKSRQH